MNTKAFDGFHRHPEELTLAGPRIRTAIKKSNNLAHRVATIPRMEKRKREMG
jgi:hypothetical protein